MSCRTRWLFGWVALIFRRHTAHGIHFIQTLYSLLQHISLLSYFIQRERHCQFVMWMRRCNTTLSIAFRMPLSDECEERWNVFLSCGFALFFTDGRMLVARLSQYGFHGTEGQTHFVPHLLCIRLGGILSMVFIEFIAHNIVDDTCTPAICALRNDEKRLALYGRS